MARQGRPDGRSRRRDRALDEQDRTSEAVVGHETVTVKRRFVRLLQRYLVNPPMKAALSLGVVPPTHALLETIGRTTGKPWRNPVGNGLADDKTTFWIVAEHGRHAGYVRNIAANPHVRVKIGHRWRSGVAEILDGDDPRARLKAIGRSVNGALVRTMGTDLLTIRITLDAGAKEAR